MIEDEMRAVWAHLDDYLAVKSPVTEKQYRSILADFCEFRGVSYGSALGAFMLCKTKHKHCTKWFKEQQKKNLYKTACHKLVILRSIFDELVKIGALKNNPWHKVVFRQPDQRALVRPHIAIPEKHRRELLEMFKHEQQPSMKQQEAMIACLLGAGLRNSELRKLLIGSVRISDGEIYLHITEQKNQKTTDQPLPNWAQRIIGEWAQRRRDETAEQAPLFTTYSSFPEEPTNRVLGAKTLWRMSRAWGRSIGIPKLTPHDFRATYCTWLGEQDISTDERVRLMRLSGAQMIPIYDQRSFPVSDSKIKDLEL